MNAIKRLLATLLLGLGCLSHPALAQTLDLVNDDTDLFRLNPNVPAERPNVLIILDNTANWNQPFTSEKSALVSVVNGLSDIYNVGLMMFDESGGGDQTKIGGYVRFGIRQMTFANKTALATIVGNLDILGDKGNNADSDLAMYESYLYLHAQPSYSSWGQVKTDYAGNTTYNPIASGLPGNAFSTQPTSSTPFNNPITSGCAKNYIIYLSNGPANENSNDLATAQNFLQQISGQVPSIIPLSPSSQQSNWADEYAKFMSTDSVPVVTYTIDVDPSSTGMGPGWSAVLESMASNSGGKYYAASDANGGASIVAALQQIFSDVQAVNSVYAATSLPVSVNVRGTNIDQVYIGMFRPDANDAPRWYGNLKMYQLAIDPSTGNLYLADATGANAENTTTGFITSTAQSFWTTPSDFWSFRTPSQNGAGGASDLPDGDLVEKGGAAEQLRIDYASDQSTRNLYTCTQGSFANCLTGSDLSGTPFSTSNTDITSAALNLGTNPVSPLTAYPDQDGHGDHRPPERFS
jgi:type IV pilus assembly protein PilY1